MGLKIWRRNEEMLHEQPGVCYGILFPTRLRVTHNGMEKDFVDPDIALAYIKKYIVTS